MFQNYLKIALRNIARHRGYAFINLAGLTTGIAVCLLLLLWVRDELSYDRFHANADRMYRSSWKAKFGDNEWDIPQVPVPLAPMLEREFPEVEWATQAYEGGFTLKKGAEYVREQKVLFVDEDFFKVFTVEAVQGSPASSLANPNTVAVTEETAHRYFGEDQDIIGRSLTRNDGQTYIIGAVVKAFPQQSHLQFDFLAALKVLPHMEQRKDDWSSATCLTYFALKKGASAAALNEKLTAWVGKNLMTDDFAKGNNFTSFPFVRVSDIHLKPNLAYVWMFGIIGAFILVMACINFVNLATARAMTRAREVGVRKALGSQRIQLVQQFFSEAFVFVALSVVLALLLAEIALPVFNGFSGKNLELNLLGSPFTWGLLACLLVFTTLLTGAFPASVLSAFQPTKVLKGELGTPGGKGRMRQGLVMFQFAISTALIIGTLVVKDQLDYLRSRNLGFDRENVLVLRRAIALQNNYDPFIEQLRSMPAVMRVSISQFLPGDEFDSTVFVPEQPSAYQETSLSYTHVDPEFADALKLKIVAGRNFDLRHSTDSSAYLLNQTAAQRLGWDNPVGKKLSYGGMPPGEVVGVVEDFNFQSLHKEIQPIVLRMAPWKMSNIVVRLQPGNLDAQMADVVALWEKMAPQSPLEYTFLDQTIQSLYENEVRMSKVFLLFAGLAIFIACLGLFGLAAFMAQQRTKEIGIRKVLGASVTSVVGLLSKEFLTLVILSLVIAAPLAWYFMDKWLQDFAYRIPINWTVFALAGVVAMAVTFLTVSFQSLKAALTNPVKSLRSE